MPKYVCTARKAKRRRAAALPKNCHVRDKIREQLQVLRVPKLRDGPAGIPRRRVLSHDLAGVILLQFRQPSVGLHGKLDGKITIYSYPITVEREGKRYYAYSDDFPGVYGLGKSIEQAKRSILEAMRLYIQHCRKKGRPVPATRTVYAETVTLALD